LRPETDFAPWQLTWFSSQQQNCFSIKPEQLLYWIKILITEVF